MKTKKLGILVMAVVLAVMGMEAQAKSARSKGTLTGVVNINEASVVQLTLLPGVGQKRAEAIKEYAQAHPFKSVDELRAIKGVGVKGLEKLRPFVAVSGATTAKLTKEEGKSSAPALAPASTSMR